MVVVVRMWSARKYQEALLALCIWDSVRPVRGEWGKRRGFPVPSWKN